MRAAGNSTRLRARASQRHGRLSLPEARDSGAAHIEDIDRLLGLIEEAVGALRSLLREPQLAQEDRVRAEPTVEGAMNQLRQQIVYTDDIAPLSWDYVVRNRIRERFSAIGQVGAGVFLRLLRTPDAFISVEDLAEAAGVKANSNRVIKVYVCRIRQALVEHGLPNGAIETGRRSYSLQSAVVPQITSLLTHG